MRSRSHGTARATRFRPRNAQGWLSDGEVDEFVTAVNAARDRKLAEPDDVKASRRSIKRALEALNQIADPVT